MSKQVRMMIQDTCPYCKKAFEMMDELREENPEYKSVEVEVIEETRRPELADSLDYWYVPTFFVDGKKMLEGVPTKEKVRSVFREALKS